MYRSQILLSWLTASLASAVCMAADSGQIAGQLSDIRNQITYVGEVVVFLCDAKSGLPIDRTTKQILQVGLRDLKLENMWSAVTDDRGLFTFDDVPVGQYRLVAQSWSGTKGLPKIPGNTSVYLLLHGVADDVAVKPDEKTVAYPRQLGNRVLRIVNDPYEGNAFLLISRGPTLGDGILGPYGWGQEFVSQLIGVTHMDEPYVTIIGLPDQGEVHAGLLNYDNSPGVGAGRYPADVREGKLRIIAGWSNGHHDPPAELEKLTKHLITSSLTAVDFLTDKADVKPNDARWKLMEEFRKTPHREVDVPGFGPQKLADVLAALGYAEIRKNQRK